MNRRIEFPEDFPFLSGNRIELRAFDSKDVEAFFKMRSDKEFMKYLGLFPMKNMSEARDRIHTIIQAFQTGEGLSWKISLKEKDELIGYIGFWRIDYRHFRGEIGFGLDQAYQQKGIMSEAMPLVLDYGFDVLNLHTILADVDPANKASIQLLKKHRFLKEAHFRENYYFNGSFLDSDHYGLLEQDWRR